MKCPRRKITLFGFGLLLLCEVLLCTHGGLVVVVVWFLSRIQLFASPWTAVCQSPLSIGFPRQEYWSGLPFPSPGNLPDPGIKPVSSSLQEDFFTTEPLGKPTHSRLAIQYLFLSGLEQ